MAGSCSCCYPACPVPDLLTEYKTAQGAPGILYAYFQTSTRLDGDGTGVYVVPIPERCRPYKSKKQTVTGSRSFTETTDIGEPGSPNIVPNRIFSRTGGAWLTWSRNQPAPSCDTDQTATGFSDYAEFDENYASIADPDTGDITRYVSSRTTKAAVYGGFDSTLPDYDPLADPPDPKGEHGDFILTNVRYDQDPVIVDGDWNGSFTSTTVTTYEFWNGLGFISYISTSYTKAFTNTATAHTETRTANAGNGTRTDVYEWLEPWTEAQLIAMAETCADTKTWATITDGYMAERTVAYAQVNVLDASGDNVLWDDDEDPETPDVIKTQESQSCFVSIVVRKGRWRIEIPHDFNPPPSPAEQRWHGELQVIDLIETFTPFDYDPLEPSSPQPVETARQATWTGPGQELETFTGWNALSEAEKEARRESWRTSWVTTDYPDAKGKITLNLKRWQCYTGGPWSV